jgi:hypothetical protein
MSWLPDSGWLRALDLRASTFAAIALGCWAVFGLAEFGLLYLGALPTWARAVIVIIAVVASLLWLARLWDVGLDRFTGWRQRRAILAQLDTLNTAEKELLTDQAANNEQTFYAPMFHDAVVTGLVEKGLVLRSHIGIPRNAPFKIRDFVWSELRRRWKASDHQKPRPDRSAASRTPRAQRG